MSSSRLRAFTVHKVIDGIIITMHGEGGLFYSYTLPTGLTVEQAVGGALHFWERQEKTNFPSQPTTNSISQSTKTTPKPSSKSDDSTSPIPLDATWEALNKEVALLEERAAYPHCDSLVLHSPGECRYCDMYPEQQQRRELQGINFTGQYDPNKRPCPAEQYRSLETINKWGGNVARRPRPGDPENATIIDSPKKPSRSQDGCRT
jgi:hypothetical protein